MKIILIKYGELTTKTGNRKLFINILCDNIKRALSNYNVKIVKSHVRMFIETDDNIDEIVAILKNIFGIHSIVIATRVNTNIEEIESSALEIAKSTDFKTFKLDTSRADKKFPIPSMEFSRRIGSLILRNIPNIKVDVHHPDYTLKIEIREDYTYIYHKEIAAAGGYPQCGGCRDAVFRRDAAWDGRIGARLSEFHAGRAAQCGHYRKAAGVFAGYRDGL